jgi:transposase-like protein
MLRRWKRQFEEGGERVSPREGRARHDELDRLQRELRRVSEDRDIREKAMAIFSEPRR